MTDVDYCEGQSEKCRERETNLGWKTKSNPSMKQRLNGGLRKKRIQAPGNYRQARRARREREKRRPTSFNITRVIRQLGVF